MVNDPKDPRFGPEHNQADSAMEAQPALFTTFNSASGVRELHVRPLPG